MMGDLMSTALKINVRPIVLMNTFSLCFYISLFVQYKFGIVKLLGSCQ